MRQELTPAYDFVTRGAAPLICPTAGHGPEPNCAETSSKNGKSIGISELTA